MSEGFTSVVLKYPEACTQIGTLRYQVFVEQLHWVPGIPDSQLELDQFDADALHFGVQHEGELVGYARLLIAGQTQHGLLCQLPAFAPMQPPERFDAHDGEVSRLCFHPRYSGRRRILLVLMLRLFRSICQSVCERGINKLYCIADDRLEGGHDHARFLRERLGFQIIGGPHQFVSGVNTYLLVADVPTVVQRSDVRHLLGL